VIYEWDPRKAQRNLREHHIRFDEAATVFIDPLAVTYPDPDHSDDEDREITVGYSAKQRLIFVSHLMRKTGTRLISARKATRKERKQHEEGINQENR